MTGDTLPRNPLITESLCRDFAEQRDVMQSIVELLDGGAPIPYVVRYRSGEIGGADEERLREIRQRLRGLRDLEARRSEVRRALETAGRLDAEMMAALERCRTETELLDLRLAAEPVEEFRIAEGKLGALASAVDRGEAGMPLSELAAPFLSVEEGIADVPTAVKGVQSILAFRWSRDPETRRRVRRTLAGAAVLTARAIPDMDPKKKYEAYREFSQPARNVPGERILAILRGEAEKALEVGIAVDRERCIGAVCERHAARADHPFPEILRGAAERAWDRHLASDLEKELRGDLKRRAEQEASRVFARNLAQMLLAPPAGSKVVMGVEPGIRRGVKIAVVDQTGKYLKHASIHPFQPVEAPNEEKLKEAEKKKEAARKTVADFCRAHKVELIGVGSGPGCREVDRFLREALRGDPGISARVVIVNKAGGGAGTGRGTEFPRFDPRVQQAISIARLLLDPLSELTRHDLRSLDVGSYHGDVDQDLLGDLLKEVARSCVAQVGVDVNRADAHLLECVPGLDATRARAVKAHLEKEPLKSRSALRGLPGMDEQCYRWCAGFLRVNGGENPLDATGVHPDHYELVGTMAGKLGLEPKDLIGNGAALDSLDPQGFAGEGLPLGVVQYTFARLREAGKDPRGTFDPPQFRDDLKSLEDLKEGMVLEGVVTKLASFGAFVDVGVDQEGLIHVSEISDDFVGDAGDHVRLWQKLSVRILGVDLERRRLSLSIRSPGAKRPRRAEEGRGPRGRRPGAPGGEGRRPGRRPEAAGGAPAGGAPAAAPPEGDAAGAVRRDRKRRDDRRGGREGTGEADRPRRRGRPGRTEDGAREGGEFDRDGRRGGRRGSGEDGGGERAPRVIEQKARREEEPEIDPTLPEAEQFRLKLERLRRKFEKGR